MHNILKKLLLGSTTLKGKNSEASIIILKIDLKVHSISSNLTEVLISKRSFSF